MSATLSTATPPAGATSNLQATSSQAAPIQANPLLSTLPSESLLRGQKSVEIIHHGTVYRLQATKLGKLILTK